MLKCAGGTSGSFGSNSGRVRIGTSKPIQDLNLSVTSRNGFGTKGRERRGAGLILHDDAGSCGVSWVESSGFTNATIYSG